jgi:hypothetical protein
MVVKVESRTLDEIFDLEPLLRELYVRAGKVEATANFCANGAWYQRFKPFLIRLVGEQAKRPELRNEHAYDLVYQAIYDELPDCQHEPNVFCL